MASLREMMMGKPAEMRAMPTMAPGQEALFSQLMGGLGGPMQAGMGNLMSMLSGEAGAFEAPAMRQFQEQIVPGIAERFTGMGAGAQSSSAFGQQLGQAGAGLAENLAMQRSGLQQQGMGDLMSMLQMGMQTPTFNWQQMPGTQGMLSPLMSGLGGGMGMMGGFGGMGMLGKALGLFGGK